MATNSLSEWLRSMGICQRRAMSFDWRHDYHSNKAKYIMGHRSQSNMQRILLSQSQALRVTKVIMCNLISALINISVPIFPSSSHNFLNTCQNGASEESINIYRKSRCRWSGRLLIWKTKRGSYECMKLLGNITLKPILASSFTITTPTKLPY